MKQSASIPSAPAIQKPRCYENISQQRDFYLRINHMNAVEPAVFAVDSHEIKLIRMGTKAAVSERNSGFLHL